MSTALTEYLTLTTSVTIGTSCTALASAAGFGTGGTLSNKNTNLTSGTTGWIMIFSQGTASAQTGAGSEIAPTTDKAGWIDDDSSGLTGQIFPAGTWQFSLGFETTTTGTYTADIHYRAYKLTPSGPTYVLLAEAVVSAQGIISTGFTVVTGSVSATASPVFASGDKFAVDVQHNIATNGTTGNMRMQASNSATLGNVNAQVVTPGFQTPASIFFMGDGYGGMFA